MPFLTRLIHALPRWKGLLVESLRILSWASSWLVPETLLSSTCSVESPSSHQVFQRDRSDSGMMHVEGIFDDEFDGRSALECSWVMEAQSSEWKVMEITPNGRRFSGSARMPDGGWYLLRFRHPQNPEHIVEIHPVGIREILLVAGKSNSANHGEVSWYLRLIEWLPKPTNTGSSRMILSQVPVVEVVVSCHLLGMLRLRPLEFL